MSPERNVTESDTLNPLESVLLATAAAGVIGSMALRGKASRRAFWTGAAALVPFAYQMKKQEEAWHRENPWLRSSAPIH